MPQAAPLPRPWRALDWSLASLVFAAAVLMRWPLLRAPPYGDEPMHYWMARHWLAPPTNISDVYGQTWFHPSWIVFQRPLFYLGMHPAALAGFPAFRLQAMVLGALLPVALYGLVRAHDVRPGIAAAAALAMAGWPATLSWTTFGLMDAPMTALLLAASWAHRLGRPWLTAGLLLAAIWTKETALFAAAAFWAIGQWRAWRGGQAPLWPLRMDGPQSALLGVLALGPIPIILAFAHGLRTPGADASGYGARLVESLWGTSWLLPLLALGLAWPRSRWLAAWGLAVGGFLLFLHVALHRAVEAWYGVPAVAFAFGGVAATVDEAWNHAALPAWRRVAVVSLSCLLLALPIVVATVPDSAGKQRLLHPLADIPASSIQGSYGFELNVRDQDLLQALAALADRPHARLMIFDVEYTHVLYPLGQTEARVVGGSSSFATILPQPLAPVVQAIESNGTLSLVQILPNRLNLGLRDAYAPCAILSNPSYLLLDGSKCKGAGQAWIAAVAPSSA